MANSNVVQEVVTVERDDLPAHIVIGLKFDEHHSETIRLPDSLALELCRKIQAQLPGTKSP